MNVTPFKMNSLLEMADGKTNVDHFVGSKSVEQNSELNRTNGSHHYYNHQNNSHHQHQQQHNHYQHPSSISNILYEASIQKTSNFRSGIAYNPAPIKIERPKLSVSPNKPKSNLSSFRLIAISGGPHYQRRVNFKNRTTSNVENTKRSPNK